MKYQVYYMKDDWVPWGLIGTQPDPLKLDITHVPLAEIELLGMITPYANLQHIFNMMQANIWDSEGKAQPELKARGIYRTSMSVGDVIIDPEGIVHVVDKGGFVSLGKLGG